MPVRKGFGCGFGCPFGVLAAGWRHWQGLPVRNRIGAAVSLAAFIVIIVILAFQISGLVAGVDETAPTPSPADAAAAGGRLVAQSADWPSLIDHRFEGEVRHVHEQRLQ